MIEESQREWTANDAKWLDSVLSTPAGRRFIAKLRYENRAKALNLPLQPGIDFLQVNALINRDREAKSQLIDDIVMMSQPKESKTPYRDEIRTLIREPEKEPAPQPQKPPRKTNKSKS